MKRRKIETMTIIRYYPGKLIDYYAAAKEAVIVSRLKVQPPEGWNEYDSSWRPKLQFPIGLTIGMPDTWQRWCGIYCYKTNNKNMTKLDPPWRYPATMPNSAICLLWKVTGTRVCQAKSVTPKEILDMGIMNIQAGFIEADIINEFKNWYLVRYPEGDFATDWVEVTEITRYVIIDGGRKYE